jgi:hypothetical protein
MMRTEWIELKSIEDVARAKMEGWEIEHLYMGSWIRWMGREWLSGNKYRGRPKQPKKVTVTSECWRHKKHGTLTWSVPNATYFDYDTTVWQRFPVGDRVGEVEE